MQNRLLFTILGLSLASAGSAEYIEEADYTNGEHHQHHLAHGQVDTLAEPTPNGWTRLGCYADHAKRILSDVKVLAKLDNTPTTCTSLCAEKGYTLAGVEAGTNCFCGNEFDYAPQSISRLMCTARCPGNVFQSCGGLWAIEIYQAPKPKPSPKPKPLPAPVCGPFNSGVSLKKSSKVISHKDINLWTTSKAENIAVSNSHLSITKKCTSILLQPLQASTSGAVVVVTHQLPVGMVKGKSYKFTFYQGRTTPDSPTIDLGGTHFAAALQHPDKPIALSSGISCTGSLCPLKSADGSVWQKITGSFVYEGQNKIMIQAAWGSDTHGILLGDFSITQ